MQQERVTSFPKMFCDFHKTAQMLCCSKNCENSALVCRNQSCQCLPKNHRDCQFIYAESITERIATKKVSVPQEIDKAVKAIDQIYVEAIQKLSEDRQGLEKWRDNYGLSGFEVQFIQCFQNNFRQKITGKLVNQIKENVLNVQNTQWLTENWANNFWAKQNINFKRMFAQINNFSRSFTSSKIQQPLYPSIDSVIIGKSYQLIKFFDKPIKSFNLLYRASSNDRSIEKFHTKCDNIKHTITLIQTQYDKIIGGYTPIPWKATNIDQNQIDYNNESFLFSVSLEEKYPLIDPKNAIFNKSTLGPRFGNGRDICIRDESLGHYFEFPTSYNNGKYKKGQSSYKAFSGSLKSDAKVKQWEVFSVQFEDWGNPKP